MEKKSKILYLITQSEWGGAQRYVFDLATSMKSEFDVTIAAGVEENNTLFRILDIFNTIPRIRLKKLVREINPYKDFLAFLEIHSLLKKIKPQILHTNSTKAGVLGALAAIGLGIKVVYTVHGWVFLEPMPTWKRWFYIFCEKISCRLRQATILLSQKELEIAKANKLACGKIKIIGHGIETPEFLPKEEAIKQLSLIIQQPLDAQKILIGTIANLYETKDIPNLIEALKNINEKYAAIIIGYGHELETRSSIEKQNLSNRVFLAGGHLVADRFLKAFDIFVLPSAKEGFPYVILEAMAAGLPIVATSVGALPEMIKNGKSGLLVPPKNPEKLRSAILKIIKDKNLRVSLGKNAEIEFKQKFSKEKMISEVQNLYNQLLRLI